jgi:broad specificity phosphatase PhoE
MTLKIYLIRHGETDFNKQNKEWGQEDISLNDCGIVQSDKLAKLLKNIELNKLFSSDLKRAMQTSQKISEVCNIKITADKRLNEYDPGEVDPSSERWIEKYKEMLESGMSKYEIRPFGGENIWDLIKRTKSFLEDLEKEKGTMAVIAHSGVNAALINLSQGREKSDFISIKQDNACINILEFSDREWKIKAINDSDHITDIKPKKENYKNQDEIKNTAREYVLDKLKDASKEIYLVGDIVSNKFGLYDRPYKRYRGSTIETCVILKKDFEIPKEWKISMMTENIKKYEIGNIKVNGVKHKVNVTFIQGIRNIQEEDKEKIL